MTKNVNILSNQNKILIFELKNNYLKSIYCYTQNKYLKSFCSDSTEYKDTIQILFKTTYGITLNFY